MKSTLAWESGNGGQGLGSDTAQKWDPWGSHFSCLGLSFPKIKLHGWLYVFKSLLNLRFPAENLTFRQNHWV